MLVGDQTSHERGGFAVRRFRCPALVARVQATRLAAVLVSLTLCAGLGGLNATSAAASAVNPQNVTAVATTDSNDDGTVQVNWAAPTIAILDADVSVAGQHAYVLPGYTGVAMYPVAPGTYTVSVVFDLVGGGTSAAGTATVTVDAAIAPDAVTDVQGSANGTDVTVSWTPAEDPDGQPTGAPASHYTVSIDNGVTHVDVPAGETEAQFTGIVPGTYPLSVVAVNAAGSSIAATASLHVTGASVASEPQNVVAQDTADGTVGVTWDPPASNGGNEIQYYEVQLTFPDGAVDPDGNPVWFFDSGLGVDGSARDWAFYNLPFDQGDYVVTVTAHNAFGDGPAGSTDSQPMVHSTAPGAPQHVSATSAEPNNAIVSWDAPSDNGGQPINEYDISLAGNTRVTGGAGRNVTISGIAAGTYTAQVTAFNSNGGSQTSTAQVTVADYVAPPVVVPPVVVPPVVKPKAPTAPRSVKVAVAKHGVVDVRWIAPASNNGAKVTGYIVTVGGQEKLATGTKMSFAGLTKATYTVKVVAANSAGKSPAGSAKVVISKAMAATAKLTLRAGGRGSDVKRLQAKLKMPAKAQTGVFDKNTTAYVKRWQKAHHVPSTGVVNAAMRKTLKI